MFGRQRKGAERERLLLGRPNFRVLFSRSQVAASLWDHGEDGLAERALQMPEQDLLGVQAIASHFEDPRYPLPVPGRQVTHDHVTALAAVMFYEGELRPLTRTRRRAQKDRPERFVPRPPDPAAGLWTGPRPRGSAHQPARVHDSRAAFELASELLLDGFEPRGIGG